MPDEISNKPGGISCYCKLQHGHFQSTCEGEGGGNEKSGVITDDLIIKMFKAYHILHDTQLFKYINTKKDRHDDGKYTTPKQPMTS